MKYKIHLFVADYPQIDPNITHPIHSLVESGHLVFSADNSYHNDVKDRFCNSVYVRQLQYDMQRIQNDFHMKSIPTSYINNDTHVIFKSADGYMQIRQDRASRYIVSARIKKFVAHRTPIACWEDDGTLLAFLAGSFRAERGLQVAVGGTYLLSREQLSVIANMTHCPDIEKHYRDDEPCVFISVQSA
jgi:hypothetical protein